MLLAFGILCFPLLLIKGMYSPSLVKYNFDLVPELINSKEGTPRTSIIQDINSFSFSAGKIGSPVYNSTKMQPKLQISIEVVYDIPNIISGAR